MDHDFLKNYQKSLFSDDRDNLGQRAGIQRKYLTQMYNYSLENMDETNVCQLFEKNLHKYCDTADENTETSDRVEKILQKSNIRAPVPLKSDLENYDLKTILSPLPCYKTKDFSCTTSENVGGSDFKSFMESFKKLKPVMKPSFQPPKLLPRSNSEGPPKTQRFHTATEELKLQNKKYGTTNSTAPQSFGGQRRRLGMQGNVRSKFVPPIILQNEEAPKTVEIDERLKNIEPEMIELIKAEIMNMGTNIEWNDIAGLEFAKTAIQEAVVWPMLRPDIFTGLRRPPKGILLFGPPGTGKTLIGKCVASQSKSTFFSISASSLTSKWVGNGEKMVRALFAVARCHQPAVIFIDEIDSLLSQRSESEHESSRRIKTEFLVQLDGATTDNEERLLLIGATNRPQELDEAARRRFVKRLYIPLPEQNARLRLVKRLLSKERHSLGADDLEKIAELSDGYSGADIRNLCSEASLGPIRSIDMRMIEQIHADEVRPLLMEDFDKAFVRVRSSVSPKDLEQYVVWDNTYGSGL